MVSSMTDAMGTHRSPSPGWKAKGKAVAHPREHGQPEKHVLNNPAHRRGQRVGAEGNPACQMAESE
jgi:hypothetical protein